MTSFFLQNKKDVSNKKTTLDPNDIDCYQKEYFILFYFKLFILLNFIFQNILNCVSQKK